MLKIDFPYTAIYSYLLILNYINDLASMHSSTGLYSYLFLNIPVTAKLFSKAAVLQKNTHDRAKRKTAYDPNTAEAYPCSLGSYS